MPLCQSAIIKPVHSEEVEALVTREDSTLDAAKLREWSGRTLEILLAAEERSYAVG